MAVSKEQPLFCTLPKRQNNPMDYAAIFFKLCANAQGILGGNYSLTPGYLQPDRAFKFGLNWLFFD